MNKLKMLIMREFWEHSTLWRLPAMLFAVVVLCNLLLSNLFSFQKNSVIDLSAIDGYKTNFLANNFGSVNWLIFIVFTFLSLFYLLDCLFSERKDGSILFWRSLPISDALTVLSKLVFACVVIPIVIWLTMVAAHLTTLLLQSGSSSAFSGVGELSSYWLSLIKSLFVTVSWSLPLMCWFLFCSAWAQRTPIMYAIIIPVIIILVDFILGTNLDLGQLMLERLPTGMSNPDASMLATVGGFVVAGLLVAATIWVRRWRDDG